MFVIPNQVHFELMLHLHILDILAVQVMQPVIVDYQPIHLFFLLVFFVLLLCRFEILD